MLRIDVDEAWDVDAVRAVPARVGYPSEHRQDPGGAVAHDVVHQVVSQHPARVGQPVGVPGRARVQHDAGRLERGRAEHHEPALDLPVRTARAVDIVDAGAAAVITREDVAHHRIRHQGEPAGGRRGRQRAVRAAVVRPGDAATRAGTAVVTRGTPVQRLREHGGASDGQHPPEPVGDRLLQNLFTAGQRHRRQELAVGQLRQVLRLTADTDESFDLVVVRRKLGVAERPVDAEPVP